MGGFLQYFLGGGDGGGLDFELLYFFLSEGLVKTFLGMGKWDSFFLFVFDFFLAQRLVYKFFGGVCGGRRRA